MKSNVLKSIVLTILINTLVNCAPVNNSTTSSNPDMLVDLDNLNYALNDKEKKIDDRGPTLVTDCFSNEIDLPPGYDIIACVDKNGINYPYNNFPYEAIDEFAPHLTIVQNKYEEVYNLVETEFTDYFALTSWAFTKHFNASNHGIQWKDFINNSEEQEDTLVFTWDIEDEIKARLSVTQLRENSSTPYSWSLVYGQYYDLMGNVYQSSTYAPNDFNQKTIANNAIFLFLQATCSEQHKSTLFAELDSANELLNNIVIDIYNAYLYEQGELSEEDFNDLINTLISERGEALAYVLLIKDKLAACGITLGSS